jgi:hypothetical protein
MAAIPFLHQLIGAGRLAARHLAGLGPDPSLQRIWTETFVWWPVLPNDESGLFWLESVWHRRHRETQRWEYRSFRSDAEKMRDVAKQNDWPPLVH